MSEETRRLIGALPEGVNLENRYRIQRILGQGGMSRVYLAEDTRLGVRVAIKENLQTSREARAQFQQEAQILARLSHPNLPRVTDHFIDPTSGKQYLVMDYVEGEDLESMVKRHGPIPEKAALAWIRQVLDALAYLHSQSRPVIHRDVKPGNIKITPEGKAMLVDFGIAKIHDPAVSTLTGARAITPGYAPPEQYGMRTTERSDIYALGATLYTMLTARVPPEAPLRVAGEERLVPPRRVVPSISPQTEATVLRAMELETTKRWQTVSDLRAALEGYRVPPVQVESPTVARPIPKKPSMRRAGGPLVLAGAIGGIIVLALLFFAFMGIPKRPTLTPTFTPAPFTPTPTFVTQGPSETVPTDTPTAAVTTTSPPTSTPGLTNTATPTSLAPVATPTFTPTLTSTPSPPTPTPVPPTSTPIPPTPTPVPPTSTPIPPTPTPRPTDTPTPKPPPTLPPTPIPAPLEGMIFVPAGEFTMGSPEGEGSNDEHPQRTVYLDAFYIGKYEVTNAEYKECVDAGVCKLPATNSSYTRASYYGNPEYDNYPVIFVSWYDAQAYCEWKGMRLPTEAEWEKAARGTDGRIYPWGNSAPNGSKLNYCDVNCEIDWKDSSVDDGYADTAPVGSYEAGKSPYGAYGMAGNVWEWVADWYDANYYRTASERNPQGPDSGEYRVVRGGSWIHGQGNVRCAFRGGYYPDDRYSDQGFRVVVSPSSP